MWSGIRAAAVGLAALCVTAVWGTPAWGASADAPGTPFAFRVVFVGIRAAQDGVTDARDLELTVLESAQQWTGFQVTPPSQLSTSISEAQRILVLTSVDQAHALMPLAPALGADFALVGVASQVGDHERVRLSLVRLPEAVQSWSGEGPVEALPALLGEARNHLYAVANQGYTGQSIYIACAPPAGAIAGTPLKFGANVMGRGSFELDLYFRRSSHGPTDAGWSDARFLFDPTTGAYTATVPAQPAGRLEYFLWLSDDNLNKLGEAGDQKAPYFLQVAPPPPPPALPAVALRPAPPPAHHRFTKPAAILLGSAGALLVTGLAMGFATHALYLQNLTEVQAAHGKSYRAPTYAILSVSGALAVAGGVLFGIDWLGQPSGGHTEGAK